MNAIQIRPRTTKLRGDINPSISEALIFRVLFCIPSTLLLLVCRLYDVASQ